VILRSPAPSDGATLWRLVRDVGSLELNSAYAYLLLAAHFPDTCLIAEEDGAPLGLVVGYRPPADPEAVFVWQVGVAPDARGRGLGGRMLHELLARAALGGARYLTATVSPDNEASRALFRSVARNLGTECRIEPCFESRHFPEPHPAEELFRIGPFTPEDCARAMPGDPNTTSKRSSVEGKGGTAASASRPEAPVAAGTFPSSEASAAPRQHVLRRTAGHSPDRSAGGEHRKGNPALT
jgi:L-2,4-diaminobutyric acid acetyltransferase